MKSKKEYRQEFENDVTNYVTLNNLCKSLCKPTKKCYCNLHKICAIKRLAIEMCIAKCYKEQK